MFHVRVLRSLTAEQQKSNTMQHPTLGLWKKDWQIIRIVSIVQAWSHETWYGAMGGPTINNWDIVWLLCHIIVIAPGFQMTNSSTVIVNKRVPQPLL